MMSIEILQPTANQQFSLGSAITIVAPVKVSNGTATVYFAVSKLEQTPPVQINIPGWQLELQPDILVPSQAEAIETVFTPPARGKYKIFVVAKGTSGLLVESVDIEVV